MVLVLKSPGGILGGREHSGSVIASRPSVAVSHVSVFLVAGAVLCTDCATPANSANSASPTPCPGCLGTMQVADGTWLGSVAHSAPPADDVLALGPF